jgi:hypothetical protein
MLRNRRYYAKLWLQQTDSVYHYSKREPVTKILPNGAEQSRKGKYSVLKRSRHKKRSRGEMANGRKFKSNKTADNGNEQSDKYNYDKNQQSNKESQSDSEQESGSEFPDSEGSDDDDENDDAEEEDGEEEEKRARNDNGNCHDESYLQ